MDEKLTIIISEPPSGTTNYMTLAGDTDPLRSLIVRHRPDPTSVTGSIALTVPVPYVYIGDHAYEDLFNLLQGGPGSTCIQLTCDGNRVCGFAAFPAVNLPIRMMATDVRKISNDMKTVITLLTSINQRLPGPAGLESVAPPGLEEVEDIPVNDTGT
ncbi:MAG: hypothetical protein ACOY0T_25800 [Myxococcota bacterium]